jgi:hypothetical protein
MSGIIGGAGSKSGVIGTTELDYEEGAFTPTIACATSGSIGASSGSGTYVKTGNMCCVSIACFTGSGYSNPAGAITISNLPFTKKTGSQRTYGIIGYYGYASSSLPTVKFRMEANQTSGIIMDGHELAVLSPSQAETSETYTTFTYETN